MTFTLTLINKLTNILVIIMNLNQYYYEFWENETIQRNIFN